MEAIEPYNNNQFKEEEAYMRAKKRLEKLIGFYWHLAVYIVVNLFLIILIGVNSNDGFFHFGSLSTPFFWGIGLFFHFLGVFGSNFMFSKRWEKRKINEYMKKEGQTWE